MFNLVHGGMIAGMRGGNEADDSLHLAASLRDATQLAVSSAAAVPSQCFIMETITTRLGDHVTPLRDAHHSERNFPLERQSAR